jgi:hypothetical protein
MTDAIPRPKIESFSTFPAYRAELAAWLDGSAVDEVTLYRTGVHLCRELRAAGLFPEHLLMELHALGLKPDWREGPAEDAIFQDRRYTHAISLLMQSCFGEDALLRSVRGTDGRDWIVLLVREGARWDPEIEMRRRDWLSCVARDDRRYITPVPGTWEQWSDAELLTHILHAPVDLRGP